MDRGGFTDSVRSRAGQMGSHPLQRRRSGHSQDADSAARIEHRPRKGFARGGYPVPMPRKGPKEETASRIDVRRTEESMGKIEGQIDPPETEIDLFRRIGFYYAAVACFEAVRSGRKSSTARVAGTGRPSRTAGRGLASDQLFTRSRYSFVSVLTSIFSFCLMNRGTLMVSPVSVTMGLVAPETVSPFT